MGFFFWKRSERYENAKKKKKNYLDKLNKRTVVIIL